MHHTLVNEFCSIQSEENDKMAMLESMVPHHCSKIREQMEFLFQFGIRKFNLLFTESCKSFKEVDRNMSRTNLVNLAGTEDTMRTMHGADCKPESQQTQI